MYEGRKVPRKPVASDGKRRGTNLVYSRKYSDEGPSTAKLGKLVCQQNTRSYFIVGFYALYLSNKTRMLRNWVAWLGTEKEREENSSVVNDEQKHDVNKAPANGEEDARPPQLLLKAKGLSSKS